MKTEIDGTISTEQLYEQALTQLLCYTFLFRHTN